MKIYSTIPSLGLQFCLYLATCLPLPSHAGMELPYWLYPEWIAAKVVDFHTRNSERLEQAQLAAQAKNNANPAATNSTATNAATANATPGTEPAQKDQTVRKGSLAPVETAKIKINEKHLSKEELMELRKQLRQKQQP